MPKRYTQWWGTQAQLSETGALYDVEVRSMQFDLQLGTARFLRLLPEFEGQGILLFQMSRRVPDTFTLDGITEDAVDRIMIQNGLHLRFLLPHEAECAQLASPHREVLEQIVERPAVREIAYGTG